MKPVKDIEFRRAGVISIEILRTLLRYMRMHITLTPYFDPFRNPGVLYLSVSHYLNFWHVTFQRPPGDLLHRRHQAHFCSPLGVPLRTNLDSGITTPFLKWRSSWADFGVGISSM